MQLRFPKINSLFLLGLFIIILKSLLYLSNIIYYNEQMDNILTFFAVSILVVEIILQRLAINILCLYASITIIAIYSVIQTGNFGFLTTIIVCFAIRNKDLNKVFRFIFMVQGCFLIIHTGYALFLNLLFDIPLGRFHADVGMYRWNFGLVHPNSFALYLFNLILLWFWLNYDKINFKHILVIIFLTTGCYLFTSSEASFIATVALCILLIFVKVFKIDLTNSITILAKYIFLLISALLICLMISFTSRSALLLFIDALSTGRIRLGSYAYYNYGLTLFGQKFSNINVQWDSIWQLTGFRFDNLYSYLLMNQGIIWWLIIGISFYHLAAFKNTKINILLIIWSIYGVAEIHGLNGISFFPILLISILLSKRSKNMYLIQNSK